MSIANGFRGFWAKATTSIKVAVVVVAIVTTAKIVGVFTGEKSVSATATKTETPFVQCTKRGVAYFESLGSSPRLSDGRLALEVAKERCRNTLTAF